MTDHVQESIVKLTSLLLCYNITKHTLVPELSQQYSGYSDQRENSQP